MARKPRVWYPNTYYHVTCRGNRKNDIFLDHLDFKVYLKFLKVALKDFEDTPYEILSYCLMNNHVHLLIYASSNTLGPLIQKVNMRYAIYFNKKYDHTGHLFQDRYFSDFLANTAQVLAVSRYIHLNPTAAYMVERPEHYPYSSYQTLIGTQESSLVNCEKILSYFHLHPDQSRALYKEFVEMPLQDKK